MICALERNVNKYGRSNTEIKSNKIDIYGEERVEVKKYKQLLEKIIRINKKLKVIGLDR